MANFSALKTAIQNAIKQNGNEEITGNVLQQILLSIVSSMGDGAINTIEQNLSSETLARQGADNTLQQNINSEAGARQSADNTLQSHIDSEALARGNADTQLQNAINAIKANIDNGYVYAGIATPSSTPVSGKVFYIATAAGTYTNFGGHVLTQGINILRFDGSAWSNQQLIGIDDVPTAGSNSLVKSGGVQNELALGAVYDVSAKNPTAGPNNDGKWESLSALLSDANLNTLIPIAYRKGGMSIKFVHTNDNNSIHKYVQARCMALNFTTDVTQWQGVDEKPTAGSDNLLKSGGNTFLGYKIKGFIDDENNWQDVNSSFRKHFIFPIPQEFVGKTASVKASSNGSAIVRFLTAYNVVEDADASVITPTPNPIAVNTTVSITIPNGTKYIYLLAEAGNINRYPITFDIDGLDLLNGIPASVIDAYSQLISQQKSIQENSDNITETNENVDFIKVALGIIEGNNLFNKDSEEIITGKYINYNTGDLVDYADMLTSDYIQVEAGQTYVVTAEAGFYGTTNGKNVASYDSNKENYQRLPGTLKNNNQYIEFTASRDGYIRFSIAVNNKNTAMMLKGTEYPSEYEPYGVIIEALDSIMQPFAKGTKILWLGDSIGEAASAGEGTSGTQRFGWSGRVADMFGGTFYSLARSGNTITKNVAAGVGSILTKLEELYTYGQTGKYLIIEGGTNDADRIGSILDPNNLPAKFGSWTKTNYSGNYDEETFCGAVDSLFYKALTHYKGVKIGFMIAQKMGPDVNAVYFANRRAYFDVIKEMCKKWGIPCLDMWDNTWLNPALVNHYDPSKNAQENTEAGSYYTDGQHLTALAYDYLATVIGEWIETL